ncbi:hypothetical protein [Tardiphaga sp.]|uniref:hypothetical protein n=1 Tax=Tardiphaga sp. TaxID=1926292 RepID=UPI0026385A25|nr:hypothetical protein [Tardiphaga sp.]MDB5615788.1 hypothetical protein [Tardiphaga sp.]
MHSRLGAARYNYIDLSLHFGREMRAEPDESFRQFTVGLIVVVIVGNFEVIHGNIHDTRHVRETLRTTPAIVCPVAD